MFLGWKRIRVRTHPTYPLGFGFVLVPFAGYGGHRTNFLIWWCYAAILRIQVFKQSSQHRIARQDVPLLPNWVKGMILIPFNGAIQGRLNVEPNALYVGG